MALIMNISTYNVSNCAEAKSIMTNSYFKIAVILECIFGVYAFVSNLFLLAIGWNVRVFPTNLRLLVGHLSFVLAWFGLGGAIKGIYLITTPPCERVISLLACRILEVITTNAMIITMFFSMSALCVERLYATIRYRGYDRSTKTRAPYLAVISILIIWTTALAINLNGISTQKADSFTAICDNYVFAKTNQIAPYLIFYLSLETVEVGITIFIYVYNKYMLDHMVINRALYDLASRFRVDQNVQVNKVMMPSMILHLLCYLPNYIFMLSFLDLDTQTKAILLHVSYLWREVYAGAHPTLAFALDSHVQQKLRNSPFGRILAHIGFNFGGIPKTADLYMSSKAESEAHFDHLKNMWSGQLTPNPAIWVKESKASTMETTV